MTYALPEKDARDKRRGMRAEELMAHHAAEFIARETDGTSLITVTRADIAESNTQATIFVSVFPDEKAASAVQFLTNRLPEFREYLRTHARMRSLPRLEFVQDFGEKNRQRLDELGRAA